MEIIWGLGGVLCLYVFFRMLQANWPQNYSDMSSVVDSASQRNLWTYSAMRFMPVYIVAVLVAGVVHETNGRIWLGLVVTTVGHVLSTNLRAPVLRSLTASKGRSRWSHVAFHAANTLLIVMAVVAAFFTWHLWRPVMPDTDELVQAVWTALFVGLVVAFLQRVSRYDRSTESKHVRAKKDLGSDLAADLDRQALEYDVSIDFLRSIILTECLQRPGWIRRLERFKGQFFRSGTYGVAQVTASSPISDLESIEALCRAHSGYYPVTNEYGSTNRTLLSVQLETHNPDQVFVEQALDFFDLERPNVHSCSEDIARDGRASLEVIEVQRQRREWIVNISVVHIEAKLEHRTRDRNGVEESTVLQTPNRPGVRHDMTLRLPIDISLLELHLVPCDGDVASSVSVDLDDPWLG